MCSTPSHLPKPRNTKFLAWDLSADSWISQRWILASSYSNPQQLDTPHTFTRKRPVIAFAGRTTSEINALCIAIYLPWVCVCVFLSPVPSPLIAHSLYPGCHPGDGGAVRTVTKQLLEKVYHLERRLAFLAPAGRHVAPKSICSSFTRASFFLLSCQKAGFKKKGYLAILILWSGFERGTSQVNSAPSFLIEGNQAVSHWI